MTTQLHQMNVSYVPKEDRLLLRISSKAGDEYRLWLTRRYCGLLIGVFREEIDKYGGEASLASEAETKKLFKSGAFEKTYEDENTSFPLGKEGVLAFRINKGNADNGNIVLELSPEKGQGISLNLNKTLIYMFHNLLTQGVQQAGWNLPDIVHESRELH